MFIHTTESCFVRFLCAVYTSIQYGDTALHVAAQEGKTEVVRLLTEAQALLDIQRTVSAISYHLSIQTCIMSSITSPPHSQVKANPTSFLIRHSV